MFLHCFSSNIYNTVPETPFQDHVVRMAPR